MVRESLPEKERLAFGQKARAARDGTAEPTGAVWIKEEMMAEFGWQGEYEMEHVNKVLEDYGITDERSICLFMATCGHESGKGKDTLEGLNTDGTVAGSGYGPNDRGAGYIQLTGRNLHGLFLETVNDEAMKKYKKTDGSSYQPHETALYISTHYPWEAAAWYWSSKEARTIAELSINDYVAKHGEGKGVFMIVQRYVNFGNLPPKLSLADAILIRDDTVAWLVKPDSESSTGYSLYIGNKVMLSAPENWLDREENYYTVMRTLKWVP